MKALVGGLSLIGLLIVLWILYMNYGEELQGTVPEKATRSQVPRVTATATPALSIPVPGLAPGQAAPAQRTNPAPRTPSKRAEIFAAAQATKVKIISYQESGNQATVVGEASENGYLGEFLDELVKHGTIRDFDANNRDFSMSYDKQLQRHYRAKYVLKW